MAASLPCLRHRIIVLQQLSSVAKRLTPRFVWSPARRVLTGVLTPLRFSVATGHFRSSLAAAALDRNGEPLVWYTYPAIDFLGAKSYAGRSVLEFGAGHSTLWWAKRADRVVSFEGDADWFDRVRTQMPPNVELHFSARDLPEVEKICAGRKFDLAVVDGLDRVLAARLATKLLTPDGAIVVDNSEGNWGDPGTYPILDHFREQGFSRVDFYGYAPGVIRQHCTSVFFRGTSFLFRGEENVVRDKVPTG
jgi:hypothetical protein